MGIPLGAKPSGPGRHGEHQHSLNAVERVVREREPEFGLIPLRRHMMELAALDMMSSTSLERADQPLVPVTDHQQGVASRILRFYHHLLHKLGLLCRERL